MRLVIDLQGAQGDNHARGIGRYSRELALAMAREPRGHEVVIALNAAFPETAEELIARFSALLPRQQIHCWHLPPGFTAPPGSPVRDFAETLRAQFLASLRPDLVHVSSLFEGLGDDTVTMLPPRLQRLPVVATCYDLIPLIRHDQYFRGADAGSAFARWYYRGVQEMSFCEGLLAISESSRGEAIEHLAFPPDRVFNIQAGISETFRPVPHDPEQRAGLLRRHGLREGFILFLGAGDIRKNEAGLLAAYARLPEALRQRHQLLIVGKMDPDALRRKAAELRVPEDSFVIVPFVPEADLNALYSACGLFVFPSLHEGFGLPVAEAMACGAPVIASNTTSLPEVVGRADATFDPEDPDSIAACIHRVLSDPAFRDELVAHGRAQAARFTWASSARRAWDGLEAIHAARQAAGRAPPPPVLPPRPSLAFVSPLPPQASGIADYSRDLLPPLARHYDITLVTQEETDSIPLRANFPQLSPDAFLRQAGRFDRVLYQVGNSHFHHDQIERLLPAVPGTVVLHDAFLSDYMNWTAQQAGDDGRFRAALLYSHGYPALRYEAQHGREATLQRFPCTLPVLEASIGLIQHSQHGVAVTRAHFGERAAREVVVVPLLRAIRPLPSRAVARAMLRLPDDLFLACSFGGVEAHKNPVLLRDAWAGAALPGRLVFAGGVGPGLREILEGDRADIHCTGRLTAEEYDLWLAAADVAVQLRHGSRGESSAAVTDALMAGLPTIVNRHGSAAELPEEAVLSLADDAGPGDLARALRALWQDPARRRALAEAGRAYVRHALSPAAAALRYRDAIEAAYAAGHPLLAARRSGAELAGMDALPGGLPSAARALGMSLPQPWLGGGRPRLLLDMSELARRDGASGIQRVVREMARRVLETPPEGWRGEAVRLRGGRLRHTTAVPLRILHHPPLDLPETPLDAAPGDVLLCADIDPEMTAEEFAVLRRLRLQGVRIVPVIYDLLPMRHPGLFPEGIAIVKQWYTRVLSVADGAACISRAVADELAEWLDEEPVHRTTPLPIGFFHLGADFRPALPEDTLSSEVREALAAAAARPTVLMTGTVEPRKGYAQALAAFQALWDAGEEIGLTIVGKLGWQMEGFAAQLAASPELGRRLHWLSGCSDAQLQRLYRDSAGLLMASGHEGFGLPIIEAAQAGLPVMARDIPVFREVAGDSAAYFQGTGAEDLAEALRRWAAAGFSPGPAGLRALTWDESYGQLCDVAFGRRWHRVWQPPAG